MVVRCTRRLLDLLGGRALTLTDLPPTDEDWYANLLWLDRKKCLLLTHAGTLFSAFPAGVRTADLRPLGPYVVNAIEAELRSENLPPDTFGRLHPDAVRLAKTASRSTLGFMNEMAVHLRYEVADAGGLSHCNSSALNHHLRRTLHNRGGYVTRSSSLPNGLLRAPERSTRALDMTPESGPALAFSPQPLRHPSRERCLSRKPLRLDGASERDEEDRARASLCQPSWPRVLDWRTHWRARPRRPEFSLQIAITPRGFLNRVRKFDSCRGHTA